MMMNDTEAEAEARERKTETNWFGWIMTAFCVVIVVAEIWYLWF